MTTAVLEMEPFTRSLEEGYSLPSSWYTDPAIFELERQKIFRRNWLYFGHADEIKEPGTYKAATVGTFPVLVTRTASGELKAFMNICRHRLHKVVEEGSGADLVLRCRYHGWSYDLEGNLKGLPRSSEIFGGDGKDFDRSEFGLLPVRLEMWGPLIFVNLDLDAAPLADSVGILASIADERGVNFATHPYTVDERIVPVNWKVYIDNVIECYHCPTVHPAFSEAYDTASKSAKLICKAGRFSLGVPRRGKEYRPDDPKTPDYEFHAYFMPPTFWLSAREKEWLFLLIVEPVDVGHIRLISQFCFPEGMAEEEIARLLAGASEVNDEDIEVAVSVQRGHQVGHLPQGYLMPHSENQLREFANFVYRSLNA